jgi:hypothetical protein
LNKAEIQARSHVPLFFSQSIGCHYYDVDGYPWSTFNKYGGNPEACGLCGRAITSGYCSPYGVHLCMNCAIHTGECLYCRGCGAVYLWWNIDGPAPVATSIPWPEHLLPKPPRMVAASCDLCGEQLSKTWMVDVHRWLERARPLNFEASQLVAA